MKFKSDSWFVRGVQRFRAELGDVVRHFLLSLHARSIGKVFFVFMSKIEFEISTEIHVFKSPEHVLMIYICVSVGLHVTGLLWALQLRHTRINTKFYIWKDAYIMKSWLGFDNNRSFSLFLIISFITSLSEIYLVTKLIADMFIYDHCLKQVFLKPIV
jgi:hypothetical protein